MTDEEQEDFAYAYGVWLCHPDTGLYLEMLCSFTRLDKAKKYMQEIHDIYPTLRLEVAHRGDTMFIARGVHERTH